MKKISTIAVILFLVSCSSKKPYIQTTKDPDKNAPTTPVSAAEKPTTPSTPVKPSETQVLEATTQVKVTPEIVQAYIEKYKGIAKDNMKNFGIPASITLSQAILESGAGTGPLSVQGNNHFGIKCHKDWTGASIKHNDDAPEECFRKYDDPNQSFSDHAAFISNRKWYADLFKLPKDDYKNWAKGLKDAGYATDPKYPDKLTGLIEKYNLAQYDAEVLGKDYQPAKTETVVTENKIIDTKPVEEVKKVAEKTVTETVKTVETVKTDVIKTTETIAPEVIPSTTKPQETKPVAEKAAAPATNPTVKKDTIVAAPKPVAENKVPASKPIEAPKPVEAPKADNKQEGTYVVQTKETLYSISKKFNTTVEELKRLNNLPDNSIQIGQTLKVK